MQADILLTILVCVIEMLVTKLMKSALLPVIDITKTKLSHFLNDKASQLEIIHHFQFYQLTKSDLTHPYDKTTKSTSENRSRSVTLENYY